MLCHRVSEHRRIIAAFPFILCEQLIEFGVAKWDSLERSHQLTRHHSWERSCDMLSHMHTSAAPVNILNLQV
jgi:hypothetical protein